MKYPVDVIPGCKVAYGLRKLASTYSSNIVDIRRASDNVVQSFGLTDDALNVAAIESFCTGTDGFITKWYDQSGLGFHLIQSTTSAQFKIVSNGTVYTDDNGNPRLYGNKSSMNSIRTDSLNTLNLSVFVVQQGYGSNDENYLTTVGGSEAYSYHYLRVKGRSAVVSAGGSPSTYNSDDLGDNAAGNWPTIQGCDINNSQLKIFRNNATIATRNHGVTTGRTNSQFGIGTYTGCSSFVAEIILFTSLADSDRAAVYDSINEQYQYGPSSTSVNTGLMPQRWKWQVELYDWLETITTTDVTLSYSAPSWDGTYTSTNDVEKLWLDFYGATSSGETALIPFKCSPNWFVINDGNGGGIEGSGVVRTFTGDSGGTPAPVLAYWYSVNLPLAGNGQGNPYYHSKALALRSLCMAAVVGIMKDYEDDKSSYWAMADFSGGTLLPITFVYEKCKAELPANVDTTFQDMIKYWCFKLREVGPHDINSNMDCKAIAALARAYMLLGDAAAKQWAVEAAKRILFGSFTGTPETAPDNGGGIYRHAGYIGEADTPETTYNGASLFYLSEAYAITRGESDWSFMTTIIERMADWKIHQFFKDGVERVEGPSGYAGRTGGSVVYDQHASKHKEWVVAQAAPIYRYQARSTPSIATMVSDINVRLPLLDMATGGTTLSNGTAAVHTNGIASSTLIFTNSPDFSTIAADSRTLIYVNGFYGRISAVDNSLKTVTINNGTLNIAPGNAANYRIERGPRPWTATNQHWPADNTFYPQSGWQPIFKSAIDANDASFKFPFDRAGVDINKSFKDEFWAYKKSDGAREFGWFVEAMSYPGKYDGWFGGTLQCFWVNDIGPVVLCRHNKSGDDAWADIDLWPTTHIWGKDDSQTPVAFSQAVSADAALPRSVGWDIEHSPPTVWHQLSLGGGTGRNHGQEAAGAINGTLTIRNTFKTLANGINITHDIGYAGNDAITELWATIPIYLRDNVQSLADGVIYHWSGTSWQPMDNTIVTTNYIRIGRNFGAGEKFCYIHFTNPVRVKLSASVWQQTYQATSRLRNIHIDMHGNPGAVQAMPTEATISYDIQTTDPGLVSSQPIVTFVYPESNDIIPTGGLYAVQASVDWSTAGVGAVHLDYSKNNGQTWVTVGDLSLNGSNYEYIDEGVVAGITHLRIRAVGANGASTTVSRAIKSAPMRLRLEDHFTGVDGTILDTTYSGWTFNDTGSTYVQTSDGPGPIRFGQISSNKFKGQASNTFNSAGVEMGQRAVVNEATVNKNNDSGDSTPRCGISFAQERNYEQIIVGFQNVSPNAGYNARIWTYSSGGTKSIDTSFVFPLNGDVTIRSQWCGKVIAAKFTKTGQTTKLAYFGTNETKTKHGIMCGQPGYTADDLRIWTFAADTTPPGTPTGLMTSDGVNEVSLAWNANAELDLREYKIYRSSDGSSYNLIAIVSAGTQSYLDDNLPGNQLYYYKISAVDQYNNESTQSSPVSSLSQQGDTDAPRAGCNLSTVTQAGGAYYDIVVIYEDDVAVNVDGIETGNITVSGPNGFQSTPALTSLSEETNGTPRVATYRLTAPDDGWASNHNGTYTVTILGSQISDSSFNYVLPHVIGSFEINISGAGESEPILPDARGGLLRIYFTKKNYSNRPDALTRLRAIAAHDWVD